MMRLIAQEAHMKFKRKLTLSLLGAAMLALPMTLTAPAFAEPAYSSNDIQPVDWWWNQYGHDRNAYSSRGWHKGNYEYSGKKYGCDRARGLQDQVWQDRNSGHPAAANDVEAEAAAARGHCYNR
jgi:hypothetical protein